MRRSDYQQAVLWLLHTAWTVLRQPQEDLSQLFYRAVHARFHRADFHTQEVGDRLVLHVAIAGEHDQLALVLAQQEQRAPQARRLLVELERFGRTGLAVRRVGRLLQCSLPDTARLEVVGPYVPRNAEGPDVEAAGVAERVAVFQDAHEYVLHQVFRRRPVARHPRQIVEQLAVMPFEQRRQPREVAGAHGEHQVLVGHSATG